MRSRAASDRHVELPSWWRSEASWESLKPRIPLISVKGSRVVGLMVHRDGQFGWNHGDWVNGSSEGSAYHYGLDVIGWIGLSRQAQFLTKDLLCCSPLPGVIAFVGKDEHGQLSIVVRHSPARAALRRFSFFGDLEEVYVKQRQEVGPAAPLGRPLRLGRRRFFHFALGYEIRPGGQRYDIFIDPRPILSGQVKIYRP